MTDRPTSIRTVTASRYVTPLREGGSCPPSSKPTTTACTCSSFEGAGQGPKALIAELLAGEVGRLAGLPIPEIVFVTLPPDLARTEPDAEFQSLIGASGGLNLALDYLPGSTTFDPLVYQPDAGLASAVVWFDAFVCNVDRTARNVNMLMWHRRLWLIDHGAALVFSARLESARPAALTPFPLIKDHVLLKFASVLKETDAEMKLRMHLDKIGAIVEPIPDAWLADDPGFESRAQQRDAYLKYFSTRLGSSDIFVKEALRARALHV